MAHFRCPTSSIVGSSGRYPYTPGDTIHYSSTSTQLVYEHDPSDQENSSDESISSSSSSTILASRPLRRSSTRSRTLATTEIPTPALAPTVATAAVTNNQPQATTRGTDDNDRRCWICYGEDGDSEGKWVSPCPCSLVAHEKCLLDWITENQKGSPRKTCASAYHLAEKSSWLLTFLGMTDQVVHTIAPYLTSLGLGLSLLVVTTTYGASSVLLLFGTRDGERLLGPPALWTWRTWVGLPSIPLALLSTRSRWADSTLPFAAFLFLRVSASSPNSFSLPHIIQFTWPPTPLATLGLLPWVRLFYNNMYYAAQSLISRQLSLKMVQQQQQQQQQQQDQRRRQRSNSNRVVLVDDQTVNRISDNHNIDPTTTTMTAVEQQEQLPERSTELDILLGRGPPSIGMLFMGTLLWPVISNVTGK
ncbi:hypothetical protein BC941DRAFT_350126 [Chlamydoabsidia padenii]|nr:hypothetical protein BC941DRAFT_350126 [Chlamydoabsidia padenii]